LPEYGSRAGSPRFHRATRPSPIFRVQQNDKVPWEMTLGDALFMPHSRKVGDGS
jgi:hypothetical protein